MSAPIDPRLARFTAGLFDLYSKFCDDFTDDDFFGDYDPISLELRTINGLTAKFWEEGIEFYPKEDA